MQDSTRGKLLAAAERILVEEGVQALTVRRVGTVSGLNPTLITYHFGTVAGLLEELCDQNLAPMLAQWALLDAPLPEDADPVECLLQRWLGPLLAPAAFNPEGRALDVIDEIASHGEEEFRRRLMDKMASLATRVKHRLVPYLPGLEPAELRRRLRFIAGATLGPPPRARPAARESSLADLLRFAMAALGAGGAMREHRQERGQQHGARRAEETG